MRPGAAKRPRWILLVAAVLVASPLLGAAAEPQPAFEVAGIVKLDGDASFALLQEPTLTMGRPVLVRQGQSIGGYRLVAVEHDHVRLESATGVLMVPLGASGGSSGTVVLVPPPRLESEARQAPSVSAEPPPTPAAAKSQAAVSPASAAPAEESVAADLKGTPGEKVMNLLKNAFGLPANH